MDTENRIYNFRALSYYDEKFKDDEDVDPDMNFCRLLRQNSIFMYVDNMVEYGHLARMNTYDITRTNPDFYEIKSNEFEWRRRYIHENYTQTLESGNFEQPCPDVYWFPVASPIFCRHMIGTFLLSTYNWIAHLIIYIVVNCRNNGKLWTMVRWQESSTFLSYFYYYYYYFFHLYFNNETNWFNCDKNRIHDWRAAMRVYPLVIFI